MPWEKAFDMDNALEAAMNVFWKKGYDDASMSELISAMGINKGSLYNAYGDKKALFLSALKKYDAEQSRAFIKMLKEIEDPIEAIDTLFECMVQQGKEDSEAKGCFLVNTSLRLVCYDSDVQHVVKGGLREVEKFFEASVAKLIMQRRLPSDVNSQEVAKVLMALAVGLRVLSRGVFDADGLGAIRAQAMRIVSG